jgi:SAM-dependent methyltransferase
MLNEAPCEICGKNDWKVLGKKTYKATDASDDWAYGKKRFKVLFDKWFPDCTEVTLSSSLCKHCGFIIYQPRPEVADIDTKYRYLDELGQDYGDTISYDEPIEISRSNQILDYVNKNIRLSKINTVLDYGGGDGRLLQAFLEENKECFLVDYNQNCIPGVTKLADTIEDLSQSKKFDLIICNHVMEHVAQPLQVLKKLISYLNDRGHIFIEVPMEVWKHPPLSREPVTHINFFTPGNLHNLMLQSGLNVSKCELLGSLYQNGKKPAVRAIGQKLVNASQSSDFPLVRPDAQDFLQPNIYQKLLYRLLIPGQLPGKVLRKLRITK